MSLNKKLTIISEAFAPQVVGSPILLANLLIEYPGPVSAISGWQNDAKVDPAFMPPCSTDYVKMPGNFLQRIHDRFKILFVNFDRIRIRYYLKKQKPNVALIICPGGEFFVAGCLACKDLGIPFMVHMHDLWDDNQKEGTGKRAFAAKWEPLLLREAKTVFAMTEIQKNFLDKKYSINCELLPHTIPRKLIDKTSNFSPTKIDRREKVIVYSGNISHAMNLDALQQFVIAVENLPEDFRVKMFVPFDKVTREKLKLESKRIEYNWLSREEVFKEVEDANLVFLPLSFKNGAMKEVKTVFATKTLDYLISGTPIVVFSPADSFHSFSARNRGWGHVIDQDDTDALSEELVRLTSNLNLSTELVKNALKEAKGRNSERYAKELLGWVNRT